MNNVAAIVLSGGDGTRLRPLTLYRCKPMIPLLGKHTLIDVAMSKALFGNVSNIFVITQYLAHSLHKYIRKHYAEYDQVIHHLKFIGLDEFEGQRTKGTADAVRKSKVFLEELSSVQYFLILSSDQVHNLDVQEFVASAQKLDTDVLVGTFPVSEEEACRMGVLRIEEDCRITEFLEKPSSPEVIDRFRFNNSRKPIRANMAIYLFKKEALFSALQEHNGYDFGMHILPYVVQNPNYRVHAFPFEGFWKDLGTADEYFHYHMNVVKGIEEKPDFFLKNTSQGPITVDESRHLMLSKSSTIENTLVQNAIIGPNCVIGKNSSLEEVMLLGDADPDGRILIGENVNLHRTIVDRTSSIGNGVKLCNAKKLDHFDHPLLKIRKGIIVIPQNTHIPDYFVF